MGTQKVFINENFRVMICASPTLLTIPVHVVPTKFPYNVFTGAEFAHMTKTHVKVWATLIYVPVRTMLSSFALLAHEFFADF